MKASAWARHLALGALLLAGTLGASAATGDQMAYRWRNVVIGGGGFVPGLVFHASEKGLLYARTDIGGAYRWDASSARWASLTDWIGAADVNLLGIDSLAVDPSDANRIYLAAGTYTADFAPNGAILRSSDRGRTFARSNLPFKLGGNELGRGNGERLAVDPHDGRVLFFGSRGAGLWRSEDRGASWSNVKSFPDAATSAGASAANAWRRQAIGVVFVEFDPANGKSGQPTPTLYAGVSTRETSLFRSTDAGRTWTAVPGQPIGLRPNHMARAGDGIFYLSYGDEPGPDSMHDGAVWKYEPAAQRWTNITPLPRGFFGWGAVAVDPRNPQVVMAATFARYDLGDELFRSRDGGAHWQPVLARSRFDNDGAPWVAAHRPHWIASIAIDPFDSDRVLFVTGYGIWASTNMLGFDQGGTVNWRFEDRGLEETVALDLISPPQGAPLLSALGDLDGFRHDDLDVAPPHFDIPQRYSNGESIDFAARKPELIVRAGRTRNPAGDVVRAAFSIDGGRSWQAFASEPGEGEGAGSMAIAADAETVVWAPSGSKRVFLTRDFGRHWAAADGLEGGEHMLADRVDASRFYASDARSGKLYVSRDHGAHFAPIGGAFGAAARGAAEPRLYASPAAAGVLWIAARNRALMRGDADGRVTATIASITGVDALGFGKAAPGKTALTLFVAGRRNGAQGIFRSTDEGASWQRIDDAEHRYGRIDHIIGDPRVFGRLYFGAAGRGIVYGDPVEPPCTATRNSTTTTRCGEKP
jgi:photosystem II stability/assembly factor-like uncharacterized protein